MLGIDFGGMIRDAILLNAALAAGILCAIIAITMFATKRKWAFRIALALAILFSGFVGGYALWTSPPTPKPYDISFVIADDWICSKTLPGEIGLLLKHPPSVRIAHLKKIRRSQRNNDRRP